MCPISFPSSLNFARVWDRIKFRFRNQEVESLAISRTWQGPRPQLLCPSSCGATGLGFPVCHRHFFLPLYQGAEMQGDYLLCHCLVTKRSLSGDLMRKSLTLLYEVLCQITFCSNSGAPDCPREAGQHSEKRWGQAPKGEAVGLQRAFPLYLEPGAGFLASAVRCPA